MLLMYSLKHASFCAYPSYTMTWRYRNNHASSCNRFILHGRTKARKRKIVLLGAGSANMGFLQLLDELLLGNIGNVIVVDRDLVITVKIASNIGWETFI